MKKVRNKNEIPRKELERMEKAMIEIQKEKKTERRNKRETKKKH